MFSHSTITDVSGAHFHFHGPKQAMSANAAQLHGQRARTGLPYTAITFPVIKQAPNYVW